VAAYNAGDNVEQREPRNAMKYHVAMIVSVLAAALLIGGACVQTQHAEQKNSALRANLSTLSIQQLTDHFWECQPHSPGEPYKRDAAFCAEVNRAMESRSSEVPPLQVVDIYRYAPPMIYGPIIYEPNPPSHRRHPSQPQT
jgi:hypothetical protein